MTKLYIIIKYGDDGVAKDSVTKKTLKEARTQAKLWANCAVKIIAEHWENTYTYNAQIYRIWNIINRG